MSRLSDRNPDIAHNYKRLWVMMWALLTNKFKEEMQMVFTILFATGENTRTGICYAKDEAQAKQKLFSQHPDAVCIKVHKGRLCFEAETIDGIREENYE